MLSEFSKQIGLGDVTVQNQQNKNETVNRGVSFNYNEIILLLFLFGRLLSAEPAPKIGGTGWSTGISLTQS